MCQGEVKSVYLGLRGLLGKSSVDGGSARPYFSCQRSGLSRAGMLGACPRGRDMRGGSSKFRVGGMVDTVRKFGI
jgi:hypothetical protein